MALLFLLLVCLVGASDGDRDGKYKQCLSGCLSSSCSLDHDDVGELWTLQWTCSDSCRYDCMWQVEAEKRSSGKPSVQYYGKWPFHAHFGCQEIVSVVSSLGNAGAHYIGWLLYTRRISSISTRKSTLYDSGSSFPMRSWLRGYLVLSVTAWLSAALFHARDRPWTERADYFTASASIGYAALFTAARLLCLQGVSAVYAIALYCIGLFYHYRYKISNANVF